MIDFGWENEKERLKRHMSISSKRKLELLYEINRFTRKYGFRRLSDLKNHVKKPTIYIRKVKSHYTF